jgi:4-hydroxy-2-oxoheptanedioate aldolase
MKNLKQRLQHGEIVLSTWVLSGSPLLAEMAGQAGFDCVILDTQHSSLSPYGPELANCIRAAYAADVAPFGRPVWNDPGQILKILDAGAKGIIVPQINTRKDAELLVSAACYPPRGRRSYCPNIWPVRHAKSSRFWHESNEDIIVMPLVEEQEGFDNLEEILSVEGVDGVYFGPVDLSLAIGLEGNCEDQIIWDKLEAGAKLCRTRNKIAANLAWNMESLKRSLNIGMQFVSYSTDISILMTAYQGHIDGIRNLHYSIGRWQGILTPPHTSRTPESS